MPYWLPMIFFFRYPFNPAAVITFATMLAAGCCC